MKKYLILSLLVFGCAACSSGTKRPGTSGKATAAATKNNAATKDDAPKRTTRYLTDSEYRKAQKQWLEENAKKDSVVCLKSGLQYKILQQGDGPKPKLNSKVCINYEGFTTDGSLFDSSYARSMPLTMTVSDFIDGWQEALPLMPVGSKWTLYVPHYLAYGKDDGMPFRPYSTLIFTIELISIVK